jgi:hypothetical protein
MRITWRDGATTLLAALVALIFAAYTLGWSVPIVDDARGAILAIGLIGLGMCIVGASPSSMTSKSGYTALMSALGVAALLLVIVGVVTGWPVVVALIAINTVVMYAIATTRHAVTGPMAPSASS